MEKNFTQTQVLFGQLMEMIGKDYVLIKDAEDQNTASIIPLKTPTFNDVELVGTYCKLHGLCCYAKYQGMEKEPGYGKVIMRIF